MNKNTTHSFDSWTADEALRDIAAEQTLASQRQEEASFHPKASRSVDCCSEFKRSESDHRLPYRKDADAILHSKAYARYADKTQVVYLIDNDHISQRSLHVQLVSSYARGIAQLLGLNLQLIEAIALGHDVGHPPFGHEGEGYLSSLSQQYGEGPFAHSWQSCRLLRKIEPLNLGLAVYDGFLCHDGGMQGNVLQPRFGKNWDDHLADLDQKIADPNGNILPGTLEGCLVKLCDTISYLARDIEDAISLEIIARDQLPDTLLGTDSHSILRHTAGDIIKSSYKQDHIAVSKPVYEALKAIRAYNFKNIYTDSRLKVESLKVKRGYQILFDLLITDFEKNRENSYLWIDFVKNKEESYRAQTTPVRMVIDYISGMTDGFFVRTLDKLVVPKRIAWP